MAQYCRYCDHLRLLGYAKLGEIKCLAHQASITEKQAKHTNECKQFELNQVDALRQNTKGYKPTGIRIVQYGGLGKQIRIEDVMEGEI